MKRILAALSVLLLFVLSSCSSPEQSVEKYVKENKSLGMMSGYVYCDTEFEARGTDVVLKFVFRNDISEDDTKNITNEFRIMLDGEFEELYQTIKAEEPAVTSLIVEFCDNEGNVITGHTYK